MENQHSPEAEKYETDMARFRDRPAMSSAQAHVENRGASQLVGSGSVVGVRRETFDAIKALMADVTEVHYSANEYTGECPPSCEACRAKQLLAALNEHPNDGSEQRAHP